MPGLYPTDQSRFPRPGTFNGPGGWDTSVPRAGMEGNYPRYWRGPGPSLVPEVNQTSRAQIQRAMLSKFAEQMMSRGGKGLFGAMMASANALGLLDKALTNAGTSQTKFDAMMAAHYAAGTHPTLDGYNYGGQYADIPYSYSFWRWARNPGPGWYSSYYWFYPEQGIWPKIYGVTQRPSLVSMGFSGMQGSPYQNYVRAKWWYTRVGGATEKLVRTKVDGKLGIKPAKPMPHAGVGARPYMHPWLPAVYPEVLDIYEPQPGPVPMPYKDLPKRPGLDGGLGVGTHRGYGTQRPELDRSPQITVRRATQTNKDVATVTQSSAPMRSPPKPREKQKKFIMGLPGGSPLGIALSLITEGMDLVSALYRALPPDAKIHGRGFKTIQAKAAAVWNNFDRLFESPAAAGKTVEEVFKSMANDVGFGMIGKSIGQAQRNAFDTTGQSVNGLNHLFGEIGKVGGQVSKNVPKTGG